MIKEKLSIGLAGILLASVLATPVLADINTVGDAASDTGNSQLKITVGSTYMVTIPATFNFTAAGTEGAANNVVISDASQIGETSKLTVKLASTNTLKATRAVTGAGTSEIPFALSFGSAAGANSYTSGDVTVLEKTGAEIAAKTGLSTGVFATVTAANLNNALTAGDHLGTVDFSVTYTP